MDETFLGENFINKVFGILVIFLVLRNFNWKWSEIGVIMGEGTFRGLFYHIAVIDHLPKYALFFQAFLFGLWHIVTPLHIIYKKN